MHATPPKCIGCWTGFIWGWWKQFHAIRREHVLHSQHTFLSRFSWVQCNAMQVCITVFVTNPSGKLLKFHFLSSIWFPVNHRTLTERIFALCAFFDLHSERIWILHQNICKFTLCHVLFHFFQHKFKKNCMANEIYFLLFIHQCISCTLWWEYFPPEVVFEPQKVDTLLASVLARLMLFLFQPPPEITQKLFHGSLVNIYLSPHKTHRNQAGFRIWVQVPGLDVANPTLREKKGRSLCLTLNFGHLSRSFDYEDRFSLSASGVTKARGCQLCCVRSCEIDPPTWPYQIREKESRKLDPCQGVPYL